MEMTSFEEANGSERYRAVLTHERTTLLPHEVSLRQTVDDLFDRIENPARRAERDVSVEVSTPRQVVEARGAQIAVADTVALTF